MFPFYPFSSFIMLRSYEAIWETNSFHLIKLRFAINCYSVVIINLFFQQFFCYCKTFVGGISSSKGRERKHKQYCKKKNWFYRFFHKKIKISHKLQSEEKAEATHAAPALNLLCLTLPILEQREIVGPLILQFTIQIIQFDFHGVLDKLLSIG